MPEVSQARPVVARLNRRPAGFNRQKRPSRRYASLRVPENGVCGHVGDVSWHAVPFRVVARTGGNRLVEGCWRRSDRRPEHGLEGLGLMAVPPETQVPASAVVAADRRDGSFFGIIVR